MSLFASARMAAGYATARPPVHPRVIELVRRRLALEHRVALAADIGCGSGLSAAALEPLAERVIGIEPNIAMLECARNTAPRAWFAGGRAEEIPVRSRSVELMTAAGSLNWADLRKFFPEARRVLADDGVLIVYDFSPGRRFRDSDGLSRWFAEFERRYPWPTAAEISPESLDPEPYGLRLCDHQRFEVELELTFDFYVRYMMTETNVTAAIERGAPENEIRRWCERTLAPVFDGAPRAVVFDGFAAYIRAISSS